MDMQTTFVQVSLADQAEEALRDQIISGRIPPNSRIDLNELAKQWSISPTPLRDAVKALENTGLVEVRPRRGVYVAALNRDSLREILELRIAFEGMAARLAAPNAPADVLEHAIAAYRAAGAAAPSIRLKRLADVDDLVHDIVRKNCNNVRMQRMMESIYDLIQWSKATIIRNVPDPYENTLPEHIAICEAMLRRDPNAAEVAMRQHLEHAMQRINTYLDQNGSDARPDPASAGPGGRNR